MSKTKRFLEQISITLGYDGEINKEVLEYGQKVLTGKVKKSARKGKRADDPDPRHRW